MRRDGLVHPLTAQPVALTDDIRRTIQPSVERDGHDWSEIERWFATGAACVWEIGEKLGFVVTLANTNDEIEAVLCGGVSAKDWIEPLEAAVRAFPAHRGHTLRVEARKGWKRLLRHWKAEDLPNGNVVLKMEVG